MKGLEALENIKGNCDLFDEGYQWDNDFSKQFDEDLDTVEKELKDKEKTDKVLEIIKSCICDISISYYKHLDKCFMSLNHYSREISKEEYDLLKEVML